MELIRSIIYSLTLIGCLIATFVCYKYLHKTYISEKLEDSNEEDLDLSKIYVCNNFSSNYINQRLER